MNTQHAQATVANLTEKRGAIETDAVTHFGDACVWTGVRDSDRDEWLNVRQTMLTASDVAALMGEDPRRDAFDVYVDKVTPRKGPQERLALDDPRFWGKVLELPIAHAVADFYGWEIQDGGYLLRSRKYPQIGCTLDAEVRRNFTEGWIPYEGKTSRIPREWSEEEGNLPTHILVQAQAQLLVTGAPRDLVFGLLQGSRPVQVPVEAYPEYHSVIAEQAEWIFDLIERGEPPTPTANSAESLRRLFPDSNGSTVRLGIDAVEQTREIQEIAEKLKELEARKLELGNMLRLAIGEHTYGELPEPVDGKTAWKWGVQKNGQRPLIQVKKIPGAGPVNLTESVTNIAALPESELLTKYSTKRRRGRR